MLTLVQVLVWLISELNSNKLWLSLAQFMYQALALVFNKYLAQPGVSTS